MINTFPDKETTLQLPGSEGTLEAVITPHNLREIAIVCHPHPLHGGTMNNKVVTITAKTFQQKGMSTIRFNYRGVGASTGSFGDFIGETEDLLAVIDWVQQQLPDVKIWLAGFSFGCYIAAQGALQRPERVQQLISIAPAVNHKDFTVLAGIHCPWLVIQAEEDELIPPQDIEDWVDYMKKYLPIKLIKMPGTSHFFHGKLIELRDILLAEII